VNTSGCSFNMGLRHTAAEAVVSCSSSCVFIYLFMVYFRTVLKTISKNYVGNSWKETFVVWSVVDQLSRLYVF